METVREFEEALKDLDSLPWGEISERFRRSYDRICSVLAKVDATFLPPERIKDFHSRRETICRHRGERKDTFLMNDLHATASHLAFYRKGLTRNPDLLAALLRGASGEKIDLSVYSVRDVYYHQSLLLVEGLAEGSSVSDEQWVTGYRIDAPTGEGRKLLLGMSGQAETAAEPEGSLIFISHSSKDAEIAQALVNLFRAGLDVDLQAIRCSSLDGHRLPGGTSVERYIQAQIKAAKCFLGLLTPASISSTYVLFELGARWGLGMPMIPLVAAGLNKGSLPGPLSGFNALSCESTGDLFQLVDETAKAIGVRQQAASGYTKYIDSLRQASAHASS